jgi:hypothetical protein
MTKMTNIKEYVCPKHNEVVLFREDSAVKFKMLTLEREKPAHCVKCDTYYYKSECLRKK